MYTENITPAGGTFSLDDDADGTLSNMATFTNLRQGAYTVAEGVVGGWALTSLTCDDTNSTGDVGTRTASIQLDPGETVACTFTNDAEGSVIVVKDAQPDDGADFGFTAAGAGLSNFTLDDDPEDGTLSNTQVFTGLGAGAYTVTENETMTDFVLTDIFCAVTGGATVTYTGADDDTTGFELGDDTANIILADSTDIASCTFTNSQPVPPPLPRR